MPPALRSPAAAHIVPLALFMLLGMTTGLFQIKNSELPWYVRQPELWLYPAQTLICGALLLYYRRHYTLVPWRGLGLALVFAVVGIAAWVLPAWLREALVAAGHAPQDWWEWLGMKERLEGFDPTIVRDSGAGYACTVLMRFARMTLVVPFVEELFWRGFLMRYLVDPDRDFEKIPFGTHRWRVFWIVTALVVVAHQPADYIGAFIWAALMYALAVRTRSLGACVVMHAAGNLLLGLYVMKTAQWGFW
ncbi:MAG: CAAX prenyl protease-related protein [Verrucomicrobiaceae bacterium]|nr:CAAX prenyl protease-related protein [Verrucomicrobiaceae bacterium]